MPDGYKFLYNFEFTDNIIYQSNTFAGTSGSTALVANYEFQFGANTDIFATDDPIQILGRGIWFNGSKSVGIIKPLNPEVVLD